MEPSNHSIPHPENVVDESPIILPPKFASTGTSLMLNPKLLSDLRSHEADFENFDPSRGDNELVDAVRGRPKRKMAPKSSPKQRSRTRSAKRTRGMAQRTRSRSAQAKKMTPAKMAKSAAQHLCDMCGAKMKGKKSSGVKSTASASS